VPTEEFVFNLIKRKKKTNKKIGPRYTMKKKSKKNGFHERKRKLESKTRKIASSPTAAAYQKVKISSAYPK
jgi:hypothetical protein